MRSAKMRICLGKQRHLDIEHLLAIPVARLELCPDCHKGVRLIVNRSSGKFQLRSLNRLCALLETGSNHRFLGNRRDPWRPVYDCYFRGSRKYRLTVNNPVQVGNLGSLAAFQRNRLCIELPRLSIRDSSAERTKE
jgi:hypothetical protein